MAVFNFIKKKLEDNSGSVTVEAAMVLPLVILSIISMFVLMCFIQEVAIGRMKTNAALRAEAGRMAKNEINKNCSATIDDTYLTWANGQKALAGELKIAFKNWQFIPKQEEQIESRAYVISEKKIIRFAGVMKDVQKE